MLKIKLFNLYQKGQGLVEYAVLVAVIIIAVLFILGILNGAFSNLYNELATRISGALDTVQ